MAEMVFDTPPNPLPRDRAAVLRQRKLKRKFQSRRAYLTLNLYYTTKASRLWAIIKELGVLNDRLDALGVRSRPLRGLAVAGEVS